MSKHASPRLQPRNPSTQADHYPVGWIGQTTDALDLTSNLAFPVEGQNLPNDVERMPLPRWVHRTIGRS